MKVKDLEYLIGRTFRSTEVYTILGVFPSGRYDLARFCVLTQKGTIECLVVDGSYYDLSLWYNSVKWIS